MSDEPNDRDRYPTLTEAGRRMLQDLREHPSAPMYRNQSGNRLTLEDVSELRSFEREMLESAVDFLPNQTPACSLESLTPIQGASHVESNRRRQWG